MKEPLLHVWPKLVVIGLQLFKGDLNNENLTKLEHTHTQPQNTPTHRRIRYHILPWLLFKPGGNNKKERNKQETNKKHQQINATYLSISYFFEKY